MLWWFSLLVLAFTQTQCPPKIGNCFVFPPNDELNRPISNDPIDYTSSCMITTLLEWRAYLKLDIGFGTEGYGIPSNIIDSATRIPIVYGTDGANYQTESDWFDLTSGAIKSGTASGTPSMPWPQNALIEGQQGSTDPSSGDRHILVLDRSNCLLMESWNSVRQGSGFQVSNTAIFNLSKTNPQRPAEWTSGDAAGLPIYPYLLKYDEIASGAINHALRFTALRAQAAYSFPSSHFGPNQNASYPYYGARFRLKSSFDVTAYSTEARVLLTALKTYGLVFADQGTTGYISGTSDSRFENLIDEINSVRKIPIDQFEMVRSANPIVRNWNAGTVTCGGQTSNLGSFTPVWDPDCSSVAPGPSPSGPSPSSSSTLVPSLLLLAFLIFNY